MNSLAQKMRILTGIVVKCQLGVAIWVTLLGCSSDVFKSTSNNGLDHIPLKPNSSWTYSRFDSLAVMEDTVILKIIGQVISVHGDTGIEIESIDTMQNKFYAKMVFDTLLFVSDLEPPITLLARFVLPLEVGNQWLGNTAFDSVSVVRRETVEVPAGVFKSAFRVERKSWILNQYDLTTYWIAPGVGIVKKDIHNFGFSDTRETWNLLSYSIPE